MTTEQKTREDNRYSSNFFFHLGILLPRGDLHCPHCHKDMPACCFPSRDTETGAAATGAHGCVSRVAAAPRAAAGGPGGPRPASGGAATQLLASTLPSVSASGPTSAASAVDADRCFHCILVDIFYATKPLQEEKAADGSADPAQSTTPREPAGDAVKTRVV
eukprot:GHVU01048345.1.p1 GENE.GHVU01048345.1~~GHVU01048345.1.p1  ORF type:complete len:162 (-),score=20.33 GHVU01048345.1:817-1302(-)